MGILANILAKDLVMIVVKGFLNLAVISKNLGCYELSEITLTRYLRYNNINYSMNKGLR